MKETERSEKFNEFKRLHQAGQLQTRDIVDHLGISKSTLYNWRKRLRNEIAGAKAVHNQPDSAFPLFTKIIPQQKSAPSIGRYIEIAIGNSMVIRIPETLQSQALQQIFETLAQRDICR